MVFFLDSNNLQFNAVLQELSSESLVLPPTTIVTSAEKKTVSRASARVSAKSADQSWRDSGWIEEQPYFSSFPVSAGAQEHHHKSQWYYLTGTDCEVRWTKRIRVSYPNFHLFLSLKRLQRR